MRITPTPIQGAHMVDIESLPDSRGFFARSWCVDEAAEHGLESEFVQQSISFNQCRGTLRGLHYQAEPFGEDKLVRCTAGAVFDVIVDLRPESASFQRWFAVELSASNHRSLYIPRGVAHGFQALQDASELHYQMTTRFDASAARGVRWNDPALAIDWPMPDDVVLSDRDRELPLLEDMELS